MLPPRRRPRGAAATWPVRPGDAARSLVRSHHVATRRGSVHAPQGEAPPHVVVLGASAGGLDPLRRLVAALPAGLPAALFVVVHVPATAPSALARLLDRAGPLPAHPADDMAPIQPGTVTTARPDHHLLVKRSHVRSRADRARTGTAAIDPLFRSAARAHGPGVTAIVLSGTLDDGSAGATHVRATVDACRCRTRTRPPTTQMPDNVRAAVQVDGVLPVVDLACDYRRHLGGGPAPRPDARNDTPDPVEDAEQPGAPGGHGTPRRPDEPPRLRGPAWWRSPTTARTRCLGTGVRVGDTRGTLDSLLDQQHDDLERSLWAAVRVLEERVAQLLYVSGGTKRGTGGHTRATERYAEETAAVTAEAARLRELLRPGRRPPQTTRPPPRTRVGATDPPRPRPTAWLPTRRGPTTPTRFRLTRRARRPPRRRPTRTRLRRHRVQARHHRAPCGQAAPGPGARQPPGLHRPAGGRPGGVPAPVRHRADQRHLVPA